MRGFIPSVARGRSNGANPARDPERAHAVGKVVRARERVRAPPGVTQHGKALEPQVVRERADVGGRVAHRPAGLWVGTADPGTVDGEDARAGRGTAGQPAGHEAGLEDDGRRVPVAGVGVGEHPPVGQRDRVGPLDVHHLRPPSVLIVQLGQ